jgi:hypothetical protein
MPVDASRVTAVLSAYGRRPSAVVACLVAGSVVSGLLVTSAPAVARGSGAATRPLGVGVSSAASSFVDFGLLTKDNAPVGITDDDQVALQNGWWKQGSFTPAPTPAGALGPMVIDRMTATGLIAGTADYGTGINGVRVVTWRPSAGGAAEALPKECTKVYQVQGQPDVPIDYYADEVYSAASTDELAVSGRGYTYCDQPAAFPMAYSVASGTFTRIPALDIPSGIEHGWALGDLLLAGANDPSTRVNLATGVSTTLPFSVGTFERALAPDGSVIGNDPTTNVGEIVAPNGTVTPLPLLPGYAYVGPGAIASNKLIVGLAVNSTTSVRAAHAVLWRTPTSAPIDIQSIFPTGWSLYFVTVNTKGDMAGIATAADGTLHAFFAKAPGPGVRGSVVRGPSVDHPTTPARPVAGVRVTVTGSATSLALTTAADGSYGAILPPGTYTVTFPANVCITGRGPTCRTSTSITVTKSAGSAVDAIALTAVLSVSVTATPQPLVLTTNKQTHVTEPRTLTVTVVVKNTGRVAALGVTAQPALQVSYAPTNSPSVPYVPLRPSGGPKPTAALGTITPGASRKATYLLVAHGDGAYDVQALVVGHQPLVGRVAGVGTRRVTVGAPVLVITARMGRMVRSGFAPRLAKAGTPFTIRLTLENRSYTKTVAVAPMRVRLGGNAFGGQVVKAGQPIVAPGSTDAVQPGEWFLLPPRHTIQAEVVVRTTGTLADVTTEAGAAHAGTRAVVDLLDPVVRYVDKATNLGARVTGAALLLAGPTHYEVGLDDRDFRTPPPEFTYGGALYNYSTGTLRALWNLTAGGVAALFTDLPPLIGKGILAIPGAVTQYIQLEAELWRSIKDDPVQRVLFFDVVGNVSLLAYKNAPALVKNAERLRSGAAAAVQTHLDRLANEWYSGNWEQAVRDFSQEGTEITGTLLLGTGVLTRLAPALGALKTARAAAYARYFETLDAAVGRIVGAREALTTLKAAIPGYEFLTADLKTFYGLSPSQAEFLRSFCRTNKVVVTLRSRATESLKWLDLGAVLKPEQIKIKTVNFLDSKWLGFAGPTEDNIGRVVIRDLKSLPTEKQLVAELQRAGLTTQDSEYQAAIQRLRDRVHELEHPPTDAGYGSYLEEADKKGELTLRWNLEENAVDPDVLANGYTTYKFRLRSGGDAGKGNRVAEFFVNNEWRSVTGDVDLLSMTHANGAPLSQLERIDLYRQLSRGPFGLMHPAADTWTQLTKVGGRIVDTRFNFPQKINEFVRGGTVAQFAPDGLARAVVYNDKLSKWRTSFNYRIWWDGGYSNVLGAVAP